MLISIIIPSFNEVHTIKKLIEQVNNQRKLLNIEIIVSDDGSTDGTSLTLNELKSAGFIDHLHLSIENHGKGAAIRGALQFVTGDVVIIQDADLEYDPVFYQTLLSPIISNNADVVYGSRFLSTESRRVLYFWHYVANKLLTLLSNIFTNINLSDMETGFKVFRADILKEKIVLKENRFGFEPEITAKIAKLRSRIYEVGISYHGRTYLEGKKIRLIDGIVAVYCILKYNIFK